tara:strand:- start:329 stop:1852 length:1524 start_codon:yes stop_codon:yes gene_type:complete
MADFKFSSYISIHTTADSNASASAFNLFDADNYSSFAATTVSSPDITFTSADGRITFAEAGTYLVIIDVPATVSAQTGIAAQIKVNGSAVYTSKYLFGINDADPFNYSFHTLVTVSAGAYLEALIVTSDTDTALAENGTSIVIIRANNDYGSLTYTADANAAGSGPAEFTLFDSDSGGTVASTLNNVTFAAAAGTLTPANTRTFLMLSGLVTVAGSNGEVSLKLYANGSAIDDLAGMITSYEPVDITYGFLKTLTGGQTASARTIGAGTVTAGKGSSFTLLDITNKNGTNPSCLLSFTCDADSDDLADGTDICFDSNKWGSYAKTDQVTASGITYTADGGTFVVSKAGRYFILWNLALGTADTGTRTISVKNGATTIYSAPMHMHANLDPMEKTTCLIVEAAKDDSFTFVITDGEAKIDAGTSITMFKVDDVREITKINKESTPTALISDDFTLNNYSIDSLGSQHEIIDTKQPPFIIGTPGPLSLRGRTFASDQKASVVSDGGKKN